MPHDIDKVDFTGTPPWHGIGTQLPANAKYESIAQAAGSYEAEEEEPCVAGSEKPA